QRAGPAAAIGVRPRPPPGRCPGRRRGAGRGVLLRVPAGRALIIVVKVGTSSITDQHGEIATAAIDKLCAEVAGLRGQGHRVMIVTSGAIAAGLPALGLSGTPPTDLETLQAISAVGQSRLMRV